MESEYIKLFIVEYSRVQLSVQEEYEMHIQIHLVPNSMNMNVTF